MTTTPWDRRDAGERQRLQRQSLQEWLPLVATASPYWNERVRSVGRNPEDVDSLDDLRMLTPIRERDLLGAGGRGSPDLLVRPSEDQLKAHASGGLLMSVAAAIGREGPDGKRRQILEEFKPIQIHRDGADGDLALAYTRSDLDRLHRAGARAAAVLGLGTGDALVSAVRTGPTLAFFGIYHLALGASILALHPRSGSEPGRESVLEAFGLTGVTAVAVPTAEAVGLGADLVDADVPCDGVRTILVVGPPPAASLRKEIADVWRSAAGNDVEVRALWAPPGARALWAECAEGTYGLHTFPDLELLELVDPVTADVSDGAGDLTYTSLGWHGTALLRFQTGTFVEALTDAPCPGCGREVPRLNGEIEPLAWQPLVDVGNRDARIDLRGAASVLQPTSAVRGWRVVLRDGPGHDRVDVEVGGGRDLPVDDLSERLAAAMGVWPTGVEIGLDAGTIQRAIERDRSPFADLRSATR